MKRRTCPLGSGLYICNCTLFLGKTKDRLPAVSGKRSRVTNDYETRELFVYLQYEEEVIHGVYPDEDIPHYAIFLNYSAVFSSYYGEVFANWDINGFDNSASMWINGAVTYPVRCVKN